MELMERNPNGYYVEGVRDHAARCNYETEYGLPTDSGFGKRFPKIPLDDPLRSKARDFMAVFFGAGPFHSRS